MENKMEVITIDGVDCYELDGVVYLKLETVARGLGFTQTQNKNGKEYTSVRWDRIEGYLAEIGFPHLWGKDDYIPENVFYRLAMKAKNEVAESFQAKVADEIIPSIRKHGAYMTSNMIEKVIEDPDLIIQLATRLKEERARANHLEEINKANQPKVEYFDNLIDRNLLTNFRDTAKELHVKQKDFVVYLLENGYLYRDAKKKLLPYAQHVQDGLFELKEYANRFNGRCGTQTLITPKGRETFRVLMEVK